MLSPAERIAVSEEAECMIWVGKVVNFEEFNGLQTFVRRGEKRAE